MGVSDQELGNGLGRDSGRVLQTLKKWVDLFGLLVLRRVGEANWLCMLGQKERAGQRKTWWVLRAEGRLGEGIWFQSRRRSRGCC